MSEEIDFEDAGGQMLAEHALSTAIEAVRQVEQILEGRSPAEAGIHTGPGAADEAERLRNDRVVLGQLREWLEERA